MRVLRQSGGEQKIPPDCLQVPGNLELVAPPAQGADREQQLQARVAHFQMWRKACSRVSFAGILEGSPDGEPLLPLTGAAAAAALVRHWGPAFRAKALFPAAEETLLCHITSDEIPATDLCDIDFVTQSLAEHRNTAPGPDRLRYAAWVAAGRLFEQALINYQSEMLRTFNIDNRLGLTFFPPKGDDPPTYVPPVDARPITFMNISYKFIMGQANLLLAAAIPEHLDDRQKGFIRGHLEIERALSLEASAYALAQLGSPAATILFLGIQAALPSVSHSFIGKAIKKLVGRTPLFI